MQRAAFLALTFVVIAAGASAATPRNIGGWVLNCPADTPKACLLRSAQRLFDKAGITADLEVQADGKLLVPVITLRGLSSEMLMAASAASKIEASLQFENGSRELLACGTTRALYICSPKGTAARKLAAELPAARSVTARVSAIVTGMNALPAPEKSLALSGTNDALARLRAAGPSQVAGPMMASASPTPGGLIGLADKALKAAGYQNAMAGLLAKYLNK